MTARESGHRPDAQGGSITDATWAVAVVNDAGAPLASSTEHGAGLREDAALIETLSGVTAVPMSLIARDAAELATRLHGLPRQVGAIFLTRTNRARTRAAQHLLTELDNRPLITDDDAMAITLTAAVLNYLIRRRRCLSGCRVLIAGAAALPIISPMLLTAGVVELTLWNLGDADQAPLSRVARDADVVIDLVGPAGGMDQVALDRPSGSVVGLDQRRAHLLALPGLFRALAAAPALAPAAAPAAASAAPVDIRLLCASARGLVSATPPHRRLPVLSSPHTTDAVTGAALHVLHRAAPPATSRAAWPRPNERDHPGRR